MSIPADLKYTESHEWVRTESDGTLTIGITDHAQEALGDVVFIELPPVGKTVAAGDAIAVIESVKAASDIYAPVSGEVTENNAMLSATPETLNSDPHGAAWLVKIKLANPSEVSGLMDATAYQAFISEKETSA